MTHKQACEFFAEHGNVSRDVLGLLKNLPTAAQLDAACRHAIFKGRDPAEVEEARQAFLRLTD